MYLQLGSLWARLLVVYEDRLCTYSLAVFEPGSLLCTMVRLCTYSLAVFGPGSLLCTRVHCELTAWQSFG